MKPFSRYLAGILAIAFSFGCIPNVGPAPAPMDLVVPGTPQAVIASAARELASAEFEIAHSDAATGILQARRARGPHGNDGFIKCAHDPASAFANTLRSTISMTVSATGRGDSSTVRIATVVTASYPGLANLLAVSENEKDCISSGVLETRLVSALRR